MKIMVACERSGRVRDAFRLQGHDAWSCDLVASDNYGPHLQMDAREAVGLGWDLIIAHPPCTYLTRVNVKRRRMHVDEEHDAAGLALALYNAQCGMVAVENPVGALWHYIGKPTQVVQPWWFGDMWTKATCLWLRGLSPLSPGHQLAVPGKWWRANQPAGVGKWTEQHRSPRIRSITPWGLALAMADQWGVR